jgi:hypothetical protein
VASNLSKAGSMKYENRVVVFIDILGFRKFVADTIDIDGNEITKKIQGLHDAFMSMRYFFDMDKETDTQATRQVTQFSDSVVISFLATERSEVFHTLFSIQLLLTELISKGILCRGGIAFGKLFHDSKVIFGPALIKAYDAESKAALFPRIILDESIISLGAQYHAPHHFPEHETESKKSIVTQDSDNMYYVDYFDKTFGNFNDPIYDTPGYIDSLRELILPYMKTEDPSLRVKYGWLINKFNVMVAEIKKHRENEHFFVPDADLDDYYSNLEFI